ncbi:hypothetical protein CERSUDRAFT_100170 [Gelatoporia subvermispora B]|uniref:Uncharacterized protein n=1 Tax=Ceriporiopsis subvermispora (strain B) TaxID=914234 RepID=M2P8I5_CERS8|nr:hypothetical protein CERSUDRAFT_100170 [Gelatoporia subvermispora B]
MTWGKPDQLALLNQHLSEFVSHQSSGNLPLFWTFFFGIWFNDFPETPGPKYKEDRLQKEKQIRQWFHNHTWASKSGKTRQRLLKLGRKSHTRKPLPWQAYMHIYWDPLGPRWQSVFEGETKDLPFEVTSQRGFRNSHKFRFCQAEYEKVKGDSTVQQAVETYLQMHGDAASSKQPPNDVVVTVFQS